MKHTPFPYMPCPECAPAAFAHTPLLLKSSYALFLQGILSSERVHPYMPGYTHQVFWHMLSYSYTAAHSNACLHSFCPLYTQLNKPVLRKSLLYTLCRVSLQLLNKCSGTFQEEEKVCKSRINRYVLQVARITLEVEPPTGVKNNVCRRRAQN